jgi:hypothetical protein
VIAVGPRGEAVTQGEAPAGSILSGKPVVWNELATDNRPACRPSPTALERLDLVDLLSVSALSTQAELADERAVALDVLSPEVVEKTSPAADHS